LEIHFTKFSKASGLPPHPYTILVPYGEVNSVKNTTIHIWLNDGVY